MTSALPRDAAPAAPGLRVGEPRHRPGAPLGADVAALLAGVAVAASFPPLNAWWAGWLGVAAVTVLARLGSRRRAALRGYLFGLGMFVPMLSFLRGFGVDAWLVLAAVEAGWFALLALGLRAVARGRLWPVPAALLWVTEEFARDRVPFGGFPWGRLGFAQASGPLLPWASVGGAPLLTLLTAALGVALAAVVLRRRTAAVLGLAGTLTVALAGAAALPVPTGGQPAGGPASVVVAAVQGNVPRLGLGELDQQRAVTVNHLAETRRLAAAVRAGRVPRPRFVVWPENATDVDPRTHPDVRRDLAAAVAAAGAPVLVGAVLDAPDGRHVLNAGVVWTATGPRGRYVKQHLVPFGEYLPARGVLTRLVSRFALIPRDFAPGHRPGLLRIAGIPIADVICFEVADDRVVRDAVTAGGRLLVVQTNNATYERPGDSGAGGETAQQLEMSRLRAVEHGRAVVVAATSGVSAVVRPDGSVVARTGVFTPAYLDARVPLRDARTVADRLGGWPERVLALLGALWVAGGALDGRARTRRQHTEGQTEPERQTSRHE